CGWLVFFASRRRHTILVSDWSSDVCSSDLADSMAAARRTPLIAAVPKMLFPFLVILPGLIALSVHGGVVPFKMHEGTTTLVLDRSEERRVGKEWRSGGRADDRKRRVDGQEG